MELEGHNHNRDGLFVPISIMVVSSIETQGLGFTVWGLRLRAQGKGFTWALTLPFQGFLL